MSKSTDVMPKTAKASFAAIKKMTFLPQEHQQIIDAHSSGSFSVICENSETPEGYYEKTFNE